MTNKELEKRVKDIGEYLGCNQDELWSEMHKLINQHVAEVIGEDEKPISEFEEWSIVLTDHRNELRAEQRTRAGLTKENNE